MSFMFLLPMITVFALMIVYPFFQTIKLSFFKETLAGTQKLVGFANYFRLFRSEDFFEVFLVTLKWIFGATLLKVGSGLGVALLLNRNFKFKSLVMMIVLLPWALPYSVSHIIWRWVYNPMYGHLNSILLRAHLIEKPLPWLADPNFSIWGIVIANSWTGMPFCAFAILSGLYSIPKQLYEAAALDGANAFQSFLRVTLPLLRPVLTLITALAAIWTFTNFGAIWLMTKGGPMKSSTTLIVDIYLNAFQFQRPGYACALSVISAVFLMSLALFYVLYGRRK